MAKKINEIPKDNNIIALPIEEAMPDNYLPYAVEVAKDRALPDVRDGLKPVHRRIIYGSYLLKAYPDRPYYKSARIVGDILGKFHPHGDTSVYDSMVIMAQDFSTRSPLIDGHGNWGSIDGDSAAAMRYTEARLTPMAMELIRDIEKEVVDMVPNYSDSEMEPKVLPARYPNLLVNGVFGIAVGLATNIPPHNLGEVIEATIATIDKSEITTEELMEYIKGPDLPTGGILIGKNSMISAYETGEGKVTLRAKTTIEKLENGRLGIVITEFPYRRNKAKLLQLISEMTGDKRHAKALESITDIRDESDRTGIRAVIELRKSADMETADKVLKYLYKKTDLQCNVNFNMVALANGKPETMGLKTILVHYVNHQKDVIKRRTTKELEVAERRFHIVQGFIKAINVLDEVISTIRQSKSKKDAGENLIDKFGFTQLQAEAILELMLYRLTGLEIKVFEKEYKELEKEIKKLKLILNEEKELMNVIKKELIEIKEKHETKRRTEIVEDESEAKIDLEELLVIEDTMITLSNEGFVKRVPFKSYTRINSDLGDIDYREGDYGKYLFQSNTKDTVIFFTDKGNMYQFKGSSVPEYKWKEKGERLDTLIKGLNLSEESIVSAMSIDNFQKNSYIMFITAKGGIKKTPLSKFITSYSKLQALKLKENDSVAYVELREEDVEEKFFNIKTNKGLEFTLDEPKTELVDRNILPMAMFNLAVDDFILNVEETKEYKFVQFLLGINSDGDIKMFQREGESIYKKVKTSSLENIIVFTDKGIAYKIPAFLLQGLQDKNMNIKDIVSSIEVDEKVINIISLKDYDPDKAVYFFTSSGLVKKMQLTELEGNFLDTQVYKFKTPDDALVSIVFGDVNSEEILVVTENSILLKFYAESVSSQGKIASGITAVSLKEDDKVIFGTVFSKDDEEKKLKIITERNDEQVIVNKNIKLQNRARRGNAAIMLVMGDKVKKVVIE